MLYQVVMMSAVLYRGAAKSLARPGRTQATATKLARRLTCFLSASVTRKALHFSTWTDSSFQRHYRFRPTTSGSRSGKNLSAPLVDVVPSILGRSSTGKGRLGRPISIAVEACGAQNFSDSRRHLSPSTFILPCHVHDLQCPILTIQLSTTYIYIILTMDAVFTSASSFFSQVNSLKVGFHHSSVNRVASNSLPTPRKKERFLHHWAHYSLHWLQYTGSINP